MSERGQKRLTERLQTLEALERYSVWAPMLAVWIAGLGALSRPADPPEAEE